MYQTITIQAGQRVEFIEAFDFVRVMDATGLLSLEFHREGREVDEAQGVGLGYSESFAKPCDKLVIVNDEAGPQTVKFATRLGSRVAFDKPPTGSVSVTNIPQVIVMPTTTTLFAQVQKTVTNASAQMVPFNSIRKGLTVQNKSETGSVWINVTGAAATQANGIRIKPGETFSMDGRVSGQAITAIGDIASNADVVVIEVS